MRAFPLLLLLFLLACRSPGPTIRADDAAPRNSASTPPPPPTVASALPLDLPTTKDSGAQTILSVTVDADGNLTVDGKKAPLTDLSVLAAAARAAAPDVRATVSASADCKYQTLIAVLDQLRDAGIVDVAFAVAKP